MFTYLTTASYRVLSPVRLKEMIQHMWDQEKVHLATFDKLLPK